MAATISIGGDLTALASAPAASRVSTGLPRPPILFVHGYLATAQMWEHYLEFFSLLGYPCYAVNLRGRSGSRPVPDLGGVRMADYVDDARDAVRAIAASGTPGAPIVFGHSMGGLVAQKLAEEGLVAAAVLVSPAPPRGIPVLSWRLVTHLARYVPAMLRSRPIVARFEDFRDLVLNRVPPAEQRTFFEYFVPDSGRAGRDMMLGAVSVDAKRVRCPLLVVGADDDHFLPMPIARRVAKRYAAPLRTARGHGHASIHEPGWEMVASDIAQWLASEAIAAGAAHTREIA